MLEIQTMTGQSKSTSNAKKRHLRGHGDVLKCIDCRQKKKAVSFWVFELLSEYRRMILTPYTKCLPRFRKWPEEKCHRCTDMGLSCSPGGLTSKKAARRLLGRTATHSDLQESHFLPGSNCNSGDLVNICPSLELSEASQGSTEQQLTRNHVNCEGPSDALYGFNLPVTGLTTSLQTSTDRDRIWYVPRHPSYIQLMMLRPATLV